MVKLTGLWKEKGEDGKTYLTGSLNPISKLLVLPNSFKKDGDTSPDYFLYLTQNEKKPDSGKSKDLS